jgi:starch synthase
MPRILMVASEAAPFVKTGGLADVLGSLPAALVGRGDEVAVVIPRYRAAVVDSWERIWHEMPLSVGPHQFRVAIDQVVHQGVRYFFVDCPPLYDRPGIYNESNVDYRDNHIRFALLNQAAIGIARYIFRPNVFHAHDWQAGLLAPYLRSTFSGDPTFFGTKCVLTIHNLGYQGNFWAVPMEDIGLDPVLYHTEGMEFNGMISFLKGGIVFSDAVTTVSPTYAREIQTPEYGFGFDGLLRSRSYKLRGILNGVDYVDWSTETDRYLPAHYSARDLAGKMECKRALLQEMSLPVYLNRPLIGIVSRFADQKGFDLVAGIANPLIQQDVAMVVLGSGEKRFEDMFRQFAAVRPDRFAVRIGYDNGLAHRIEAGSDMFLMPSLYEPCGLNQIYSLRYGTVPIVRATGGLDDTVDTATGFKFGPYSPPALAGVIGEALYAWRSPDKWKERMRLGMSRDFSWERSAAEYQRMYAQLASP